MRCEQVRPLLNTIVDDELNFWQHLRVSRHLQRCAACAAELAAIRPLAAEAAGWRNVKAPDGLEARIAAAIAAVPEPANASHTPMPMSRRSLSQEDTVMNSHIPSSLLIPRTPIWRWQTFASLALLALTLTVC